MEWEETQTQKFHDIFTVPPYEKFDLFYDACLRTEDGKCFKVHKMHLAHQSDYFRALFCGDFEDGSDVMMHGLNGSTLESILLYMYTGHTHLDHENILNILIASDYLLIDSLLKLCKSFALSIMSVTNCLSLFLSSWMIQKLDITGESYRFLLVHFEEVLHNSEDDISYLPLEALSLVLKSKSLNVSEEIIVWKVIVHWVQKNMVERLPLVPILLSNIDFGELNDNLVNEILLHPIIRENPSCASLGLCNHSSPFSSSSINQCCLQNEIKPDHRIPHSLHFIIQHFLSRNKCDIKVYLTYDDELDYWRQIGNLEFCPDFLVPVGYLIFLFDIWENKIVAFDVAESIWYPIIPPPVSRCRYCVVSVGGKIYVMGGSTDTLEESDVIQCYDPCSNTWDIIIPMLPMILSDAVAMNGCIYAIGDIGGHPNPTMTVQVYFPSLNIWSFVSAPSAFRHDFTTIAFHGRLYVIGGQKFDEHLTSCEEYEPSEDVWSSLPDLPFTYVSPKAIILKDNLLVYENYLETRRCGKSLPPVLWNEDKRKWDVIEECSPYFNVHLYAFCSLDDLYIVRELAKKNRRPGRKWERSSLCRSA